jgi:hypothetical protein
MTHDVETSAGRDFCSELMDMDDSFGIKASFQIVPEKRYRVSPDFLKGIRDRAFEIGVQDLNHDGRLFDDREEFLRRVKRINLYGKEYGARGFRSAALYRNLHWFDQLDFSYDMSVPTSAHLEAQEGGCCTVMPYFIGQILELPLTTAQDYSLWHILGDYSIEVWRRQLHLIRQRHGLISFIIHPDYLLQKKACATYRSLLNYLSELRSEEQIWAALPGDVDRWWRQRSLMQLVPAGNSWRIEGQGSERARIAYARLQDGRIVYDL